MVSDDPWQGLTPPAAPGKISAHRVDADHPWDFFWARDAEGRFLLVLGYAGTTGPKRKDHLPKLRGIEASDLPGEEPGRRLLVLRLLDEQLRDPFVRLAKDLVDATQSAVSESDAVRKAVTRLWRWHYLLRGGGQDRLSEQEQQGLIGELLLLERLLLPRLPAADSVAAWGGPLGSPKDFTVGRVALESKAHRGAAPPYVAISSEHQLDDDGLDALFLIVVELDRATTVSPEGTDLSAVARRVQERVQLADPGAAEAFEAKLAATGFRWDDDYTASPWVEGRTTFYLVDEDFPRIGSSDAPAGVSEVRYRVALAACQGHEVEEATVVLRATPKAGA